MSKPTSREYPEQPQINDPPSPEPAAVREPREEEIKRRAIEEYTDIDDGTPVGDGNPVLPLTEP
jgi:hypothetical protein